MVAPKWPKKDAVHDELVVMFVEGEAIHLWHALRDEVPVPWRKPCTDE